MPAADGIVRGRREKSTCRCQIPAKMSARKASGQKKMPRLAVAVQRYSWCFPSPSFLATCRVCLMTVFLFLFFPQPRYSHHAYTLLAYRSTILRRGGDKYIFCFVPLLLSIPHLLAPLPLPLSKWVVSTTKKKVIGKPHMARLAPTRLGSRYGNLSIWLGERSSMPFGSRLIEIVWNS